VLQPSEPPSLQALIASLDWQAAWWQPWRELGWLVCTRIQAGDAVHAALNHVAQHSVEPSGLHTSQTSGVRFVPQSTLPMGTAYEAFIFETKTVPTRDNLHDFFNGLAWLRFPAIKARLNALQYAEIEKNGVSQSRGPLRDALTLFDENAAFLDADMHAPVLTALRAHDWQTAFQIHRHLLSEHPPLLFGHALLEKLVAPYKSIVAHVFPVPGLAGWVGQSHSSALDCAVAAQLKPASLLPKPFAPLAVLGVPLWWSANEKPDFYTDSTVFRPPRT
jgi:Protein of unknown function (DUF3025)